MPCSRRTQSISRLCHATTPHQTLVACCTRSNHARLALYADKRIHVHIPAVRFGKYRTVETNKINVDPELKNKSHSKSRKTIPNRVAHSDISMSNWNIPARLWPDCLSGLATDAWIACLTSMCSGCAVGSHQPSTGQIACIRELAYSNIS